MPVCVKIVSALIWYVYAFLGCEGESVGRSGKRERERERDKKYVSQLKPICTCTVYIATHRHTCTCSMELIETNSEVHVHTSCEGSFTLTSLCFLPV